MREEGLWTSSPVRSKSSVSFGYSESIKIDVSHLKINDYIRVKNLQVDPKVTVLTEPEVVIVTVVPPVKEEVPAEAAAAEPEVIKKGKTAEEGEEEKKS